MKQDKIFAVCKKTGMYAADNIPIRFYFSKTEAQKDIDYHGEDGDFTPVLRLKEIKILEKFITQRST